MNKCSCKCSPFARTLVLGCLEETNSIYGEHLMSRRHCHRHHHKSSVSLRLCVSVSNLLSLTQSSVLNPQSYALHYSAAAAAADESAAAAAAAGNVEIAAGR